MRDAKGRFVKGAHSSIQTEFKKGQAPKHKGKKLGPIGRYIKRKPMSEEHKQKISIANKGRKFSEKTREKMSESKKGISNPVAIKNLGVYAIKNIKTRENSANWKGGITPQCKIERQRFRQLMQKKVFERDNHICQMCGRRGGNLQVDHVRRWSDFPELRFDINNCRTLCQNCHYFVTFGKIMPDTVKSWGHNFSRGRSFQ